MQKYEYLYTEEMKLWRANYWYQISPPGSDKSIPPHHPVFICTGPYTGQIGTVLNGSHGYYNVIGKNPGKEFQIKCRLKNLHPVKYATQIDSDMEIAAQIMVNLYSHALTI